MLIRLLSDDKTIKTNKKNKINIMKKTVTQTSSESTPNLTIYLKGLYMFCLGISKTKFASQMESEEKFITEVRNFAYKISPLIQYTNDEQTRLLKLIYKNYLQILSRDIKKITTTDLDTLFIFGSRKWMNENEENTYKEIIHSVKRAALDLDIAEGKHNKCEEILKTINELFFMPRENGESNNEFLLHIERKFLDAAEVQFNKIKQKLTQGEQNNLLQNVFF